MIDRSTLQDGVPGTALAWGTALQAGTYDESSAIFQNVILFNKTRIRRMPDTLE